MKPWLTRGLLTRTIGAHHSRLAFLMEQRNLKVERLGRVEYGAALDIQKQTERAVLAGEQPDTLLLLEHPHTLTLGRRAAEAE